MKFIFNLLAIIIIFSGCQSSGTEKNVVTNKTQFSTTDSSTGRNKTPAYYSILPRYRFTLYEAEKILGEPAYLSDSATTRDNDALVYKCTYTAVSRDQKAGKTGVIYFLFEQYPNDSASHSVYDFIKKANEYHQGIKILHHLGDEAYFHSDDTAFYFILARKGNRMIRMKLNKLTAKSSLTEFNLMAEKIVESL